LRAFTNSVVFVKSGTFFPQAGDRNPPYSLLFLGYESQSFIEAAELFLDGFSR
jgi:hypothetical protein